MFGITGCISTAYSGDEVPAPGRNDLPTLVPPQTSDHRAAAYDASPAQLRSEPHGSPAVVSTPSTMLNNVAMPLFVTHAACSGSFRRSMATLPSPGATMDSNELKFDGERGANFFHIWVRTVLFLAICNCQIPLARTIDLGRVHSQVGGRRICIFPAPINFKMISA